MPIQKTNICGYCGESCIEITRDHIIPKNLWGEHPLPDNLATILACEKCHKELDQNEAEYFRNVIVAMAGDGKHAVASSVLHGPMTRSFKTKPSKLATIASDMKQVPRFSDIGLYLGNAWTFRLDIKRFNSYITKIILGLYAYKSNNQPLPRDYEVSVYPGNGFWKEIVCRGLIEQMGPWEHFKDDTVFAWKYVRDNQDKSSFACVLSFYGKVAVFALVSRNDETNLQKESSLGQEAKMLAGA